MEPGLHLRQRKALLVAEIQCALSLTTPFDDLKSTYVARKIDDWMDGVIKDPNLAPNHSFRHYLKSQLLDRDVPERISDLITGHTTPGIGRKYEHVEMWKKFDAISKLPVILLQAA